MALDLLARTLQREEDLPGHAAIGRIDRMPLPCKVFSEC